MYEEEYQEEIKKRDKSRQDEFSTEIRTPGEQVKTMEKVQEAVDNLQKQGFITGPGIGWSIKDAREKIVRWAEQAKSEGKEVKGGVFWCHFNDHGYWYSGHLRIYVEQINSEKFGQIGLGEDKIRDIVDRMLAEHGVIARCSKGECRVDLPEEEAERIFARTQAKWKSELEQSGVTDLADFVASGPEEEEDEA